VTTDANYTGIATRAFTRAQGRLTEIPLDVLPLDTLTMCWGTSRVVFPPLSIRLTPAQLGLES
jgi:hypothetical protein